MWFIWILECFESILFVPFYFNNSITQADMDFTDLWSINYSNENSHCLLTLMSFQIYKTFVHL